MSTTPATVLVVDDDPLNRAMLSMSLGAEGHQVREAGNGREAIAVLAAEAIDVVLTDIEMPEMDGYGLLRHRSGDDRLKTIPFIVISGVDEMDSIVACIKLGAEDYLPKPFDPGAAARPPRGVPRPEADDRRAARVEHAPQRAGRREGARGRAAQRCCGASSRPQFAEAIAAGGDVDPRQPPPRDHGAVLRPARLHLVRRDGRARRGHGGAARVPPRRRPDDLRARRHHRPVHRRRHAGVLQRPRAARRPGVGRRAAGDRDAGPHRRPVAAVAPARPRPRPRHRHRRRLRHLRRDRLRGPHRVHGDRHRREPRRARVRHGARRSGSSSPTASTRPSTTG